MAELEANLIPVEAQDDFYVVSTDWLRAAIPFPRREERERLLRRGYKAQVGMVHIEGRSRRARILLAPQDEDQAFAMLETGDPTFEAADPTAASHSEMDVFWSDTKVHFGLSEGVLPEQRAEIETAFIEPRLSTSKGSDPIAWGSLRDNNYLLISGAPGSGKTTLLRHWLLWHVDRAQRGEARVHPLSLSLRSYKVGDTIEQALRREAEARGAPWLARDLAAYAARGALAIAFDGVDEVPVEDRTEALSRISAFTREFSRCRYLVTTRPDVSVNLDVGLLRAELLPLDSPRLRQFVYYRLRSGLSWKRFATRVEAEPALHWIARNPLALSFLIARYQRGELKPSYVSEIMTDVVELFIDNWDASRGVIRTRDQVISPAAKRKLLAWVSRRDWNEERAKFPLPDTDEGRKVAALRMLSEHTGLLDPELDTVAWTFKDPAMKAYFQAVTSVSALTAKEEEFRDLLKGPLASVETALSSFVAFMSSDVDQQIGTMLKEARSEVALAVRLTDAISQDLALSEETISSYADLVSRVLYGILAASSVEVCEGGAEETFSLRISWPGVEESGGAGLAALVAALHRARDGAGVDVVRQRLRSKSGPALAALERLLQAEGELTLEAPEKCVMKWDVRPILPDVPD